MPLTGPDLSTPYPSVPAPSQISSYLIVHPYPPHAQVGLPQAREEENKRQMEEKQAMHEARIEDFEAERERQLEVFRLMQEKKSAEAEARVKYITQSKEFQAQNAQVRSAHGKGRVK